MEAKSIAAKPEGTHGRDVSEAAGARETGPTKTTPATMPHATTTVHG